MNMDIKEEFALLKKSITVNKLPLRNRIVMPPMATGKAIEGAPDEDMIAHYEARAKATGLIIVEHEYVSCDGRANKNQLSMADDALIPYYKKLTDAVHKCGAAIFAQINHAGAAAKDIDCRPIAPSNVSLTEDSEAPAEMTSEDIIRVKADFVKAALRVQKSGFDGVEIHAAHAYLLNQFYSPITNHRNDEYTGKSLAGRIRLQCEIIKEVRAAVGADYPVAIRFGAFDYREGGSLREDIPQVCKSFVEAGVDLIDISGGLNRYTVPGNSSYGWFSDLSRLAKSAVGVPVIVTGGVTIASEAEDILERGDADMIGVGRMMIKNPAWAENIY